MNLLRVRYFPLFLLLSLVLVLLVPYYYFESHPTTLQPPPSVDGAGAPGDNPTWRPQSLLQGQELSSLENEIPRDNVVDSDRQRLAPQQKPVGAADGGFQQLHRGGGPLQGQGQPGVDGFLQLHPRAAEFALQMARDRLRLERHGIHSSPAFRQASGGGMERNSRNGSTSDQQQQQQYAGADEPDPESSPEKVQVLIMSYFRGGTTFFGDLLNQHPGTYYNFEPLHAVSRNDQVSGPEQNEQALQLLRHLLDCDYQSIPEYLNHVKNPNHRFIFEHNRRLWLGCQFHPPLCFEPKFLSSLCDMHPMHVFKIVRLRLESVLPLLNEFPKLKLIYFVRDPRGLYSSRRDLDWCNATRSCIEPDVYCADMQRDLAAALELRRLYPDRFLALRYEDLALDTESYMQQVLRFLQIESSPRMFRFIDSHTRPRLGEDLGGPYSTRRDSKKTAFQWRSKLSPQEVAYIESSCGEVIKQLALP